MAWFKKKRGDDLDKQEDTLVEQREAVTYKKIEDEGAESTSRRKADSVWWILKAIKWPTFLSALGQASLMLAITALIGGFLAVYTAYIEHYAQMLMR